MVGCPTPHLKRAECAEYNPAARRPPLPAYFHYCPGNQTVVFGGFGGVMARGRSRQRAAERPAKKSASGADGSRGDDQNVASASTSEELALLIEESESIALDVPPMSESAVRAVHRGQNLTTLGVVALVGGTLVAVVWAIGKALAPAWGKTTQIDFQLVVTISLTLAFSATLAGAGALWQFRKAKKEQERLAARNKILAAKLLKSEMRRKHLEELAKRSKRHPHR